MSEDLERYYLINTDSSCNYILDVYTLIGEDIYASVICDDVKFHNNSRTFEIIPMDYAHNIILNDILDVVAKPLSGIYYNNESGILNVRFVKYLFWIGDSINIFVDYEFKCRIPIQSYSKEMLCQILNEI